MKREGTPRFCQGTALCDWGAWAADGAARGRGGNVIELDADGRIAKVVGFWGA